MAKSPEQIYDELLVLKCQGGDLLAFEELVTRWEKRIWRHAYLLNIAQLSSLGPPQVAVHLILV
ncbi:hypothetical protein HQ563_10510 [bacterium]|nr:hypothetical protein [bacterium]